MASEQEVETTTTGPSIVCTGCGHPKNLAVFMGTYFCPACIASLQQSGLGDEVDDAAQAEARRKVRESWL